MKNKLIDLYLHNALFYDLIIIIILWILNTYVELLPFRINNKEENLSILSDIIAASISLAGFILASLTVIAAIKSNIANKTADTAKNPLELFFSPNNYRSIVKVFQGSIIELTIVFVSAYIIWILINNICNNTLFKILICLVFLTAMSVFRSLAVLFKIINIKDYSS